MHPFQLSRAASVEHAIQAGAAGATPDTADAMPAIRYLAGGTTLIDLMKLDVEQPAQLIDISRLPLASIDASEDGGVRIGATVRNADLAHDARIQRDYAVLSEALLAGASAQLRNKATTAGNLLQRTRCVYFRDPAMACNKREPGSGCAAIGGYNRNLAILGTSDSCIASNPSDMNVALAALDAVIHIQGVSGERDVAVRDFFQLPRATPHIEHVLKPGELITHVSLPAPVAGARSLYLKLRDRASYEFALASTAVVLKLKDGKVDTVRLAMGGVGSVPWCLPEVEDFLTGKPATLDTFEAAAELTMQDARPQSENGFKVELGKRCLINALITATKPA